MEQILAKLIEPDNSSITQGTLELQEALSKPEAIGELCNVVVSSQNISIRHYAAVVLRKKLSKSVNWNKVSLSDREIIKNGMLKALVDEPEKQVKKAICQFVAHIANHELPNNNWNQLIQFLEQVNTSNDLAQREMGMYALGIILDIGGDNFKQPEKQASLCTLFNNTLNSIPDLNEPLAYLTVIAMHHYMTACDTAELTYNWPKVYETVQAVSGKRPDRALECLDLIDDLLEMEDLGPGTVNVSDIAQLSLHLAETSTDDDLQEKALNVLSSVVKAKVKPSFYAKNNGLLERTVDVLLKLMSVPPLDDACEDYYIDQDANAPSVYAASTLDDMAIHIPPTKLMTGIQDKVVAYLTSPDPYKRKGGYIALAAVTEGASVYIGKLVIYFLYFNIYSILPLEPVD
uniref:Importin-4 n=1 Tax=Cacopsylla melanoneura TaxID=428564 RepID=A0A8D9AAW7_9HEMI